MVYVFVTLSILISIVGGYNIIGRAVKINQSNRNLAADLALTLINKMVGCALLFVAAAFLIASAFVK